MPFLRECDSPLVSHLPSGAPRGPAGWETSSADVLCQKTARTPDLIGASARLAFALPDDSRVGRGLSPLRNERHSNRACLWFGEPPAPPRNVAADTRSGACQSRTSR